MQDLAMSQLLESRQKLAHLVRDLKEAQLMMRQAQSDGAFDSGCAVAWGVAIAGLDAVRQVLSKDPKVALMFSGSDHVISLANNVLEHFQRAPMMKKSDLLESLPATLRLASSTADKVSAVQKIISAAPKVLPGTIKTISLVEKKAPLVAYVLNTPVLKGYLWKYKNYLSPYFKKIPGNLGEVVDTLTLVVQDGALILDAYDSAKRNNQQGAAALLRVHTLIEKQRSKLNDMDRQIMYLFELQQQRSNIA